MKNYNQNYIDDINLKDYNQPARMNENLRREDDYDYDDDVTDLNEVFKEYME